MVSANPKIGWSAMAENALRRCRRDLPGCAKEIAKRAEQRASYYSRRTVYTDDVYFAKMEVIAEEDKKDAPK